MNVSAKLDVEPLRRATAALGKVASRTVMTRSLTDARQTMEVTVRREAQKSINLPARAVRKALKPRSRLNLRNLQAEVVLHGLPVPIIDFRGTRATKRGVTAKIKPGGKRVRFKHAFVATMQSGHRGVFNRDVKRAKPRKKPKWSALPIKELVGTNIVAATDRPDMRRRTMDTGVAAFTREMKRQLELAHREGALYGKRRAST